LNYLGLEKQYQDSIDVVLTMMFEDVDVEMYWVF